MLKTFLPFLFCVIISQQWVFVNSMILREKIFKNPDVNTRISGSVNIKGLILLAYADDNVEKKERDTVEFGSCSVEIMDEFVYPGSAANRTSGEECALSTECLKIQQCPSIKNRFKTIIRKPFCNLNQRKTYVCCPVTQPPYVPEKDDTKRVVKECQSYQSVERNCDKPLIVGGKKADPKEFPFMALLYYKNGTEVQWLCGGTLISSRFVMSAAHCFYVENVANKVRLGELDYNSTEDDAAPIDFDIKNYTIHEGYDYYTNFHDIVLIELDGVVTFNEYIMPACLPLVDGREFEEFLATGWGAIKDAGASSTYLLKVKLDSFNDATCLEKLDKRAQHTINTTIQMCAGSFHHERDTCTGDSGGPLFVDHPDDKCMFLVVGITSYSEGGCANKNYPGFYTRVATYVDWIEHIVWR